ncbi:ROK family protein [Gorillibacterium sp. CAU 1737]|uniref:ROK family protein n=1 Tax=Gorillibacterium sp. CAU 1737 TaxID=3140362 RepID=UPI0032609D4D
MSSYRIGIDLGGTNIKSAIFDADNHLLLERSDPTEASSGPFPVLARIANIVREMLAQQAIASEQVECMGMGIPGLLNPATGMSFFSPNFPGWENIAVVEEMQRHFPFPIYIDNDVRINLYGEWKFGAGVGRRNLLLVTLGTGLGSGIVVDGRVLYGQTASVGEIGHLNMFREGRPCRCGSSGCLGRYVSAVGMVRTFTERLDQGEPSVVRQWVDGDTSAITARMISDAYDAGDGLARQVMKETGELFGFGLGSAINLFNPELVIIGGGMSAAGERLLAPVRETVALHSLKVPREACEIVPAKLGGRAGMIGAAAYAAERHSAERRSAEQEQHWD